jgi:outer membrane protein
MKMNKYKQLLTAGFFVLTASIANAQTNNANTGGQTFTLQQAIDYAIKNSPTVQNANTDYELAKAQKNQIRGIGLPQISASADYRSFERVLFTSIQRNAPDVVFDQYLDTAANPVPKEVFLNNLPSQGGDDGGSNPIFRVFGSPFTGTLGLSASQILFSSDYIVALQTAKTYLEFAKQGITVSEAQTKTNVSKSYYMVLVSKEKQKLLEANIAKLKKSKDELSAYNKQGFVEKIDLDRLEVAFNNLETELEKVKRLINLSEASLKFTMSYDLQQAIVLSDSIVNVSGVSPIAYAKPDYNSRPEYALAQKGQVLNRLALKREEYSVLPTVAAYSQLNWTNYNGLLSDEFYKGFHWNRQWVIGASISMPLFSGGQKYYSQKMAKLKLLKTGQDIKTLENAINIETQSAVVNYNNAILSIQSQKKNMDLANEILRVAQIKYTNGSGSNLEVLNAQTSLREAQINYTDALYAYYNAKIDYEKATGTLK